MSLAPDNESYTSNGRVSKNNATYVNVTEGRWRRQQNAAINSTNNQPPTYLPTHPLATPPQTSAVAKYFFALIRRPFAFFPSPLSLFFPILFYLTDRASATLPTSVRPRYQFKNTRNALTRKFEQIDRNGDYHDAITYWTSEIGDTKHSVTLLWPCTKIPKAQKLDLRLERFCLIGRCSFTGSHVIIRTFKKCRERSPAQEK